MAGKKKSLKVAAVETLPPEKGVEEIIPTATELAEASLASLNLAIERYELGMQALNDAGAAGFFKIPGFDPDQRKANLAALRDFSEKACFALTSLRDEVQIALGMGGVAAPKAPIDCPSFTVQIPDVPVTAILKADATKADIARAADLFAIGLGVIAHTPITAFEAPKYVGLLEFFSTIQKDLKARAEKAAA